MDELVAEGTALHHCVASSRYIERHKDGKTTILFVRRKEAKKEPFYTLEYQGKRLIQVYGKYNTEPTEEVEKILDKWLKRVTHL